jgi:hypothetical protein
MRIPPGRAHVTRREIVRQVHQRAPGRERREHALDLGDVCVAHAEVGEQRDDGGH